MLAVDIHAVDHCNFTCRLCTHFSPGCEPQYHDAEEYIENIKRLHNWHGVKSVAIVGGEPLLHPKIWEFIDVIRNSGSWKIRLFTNGFWAESHPEWMGRLREAVDDIWVSVHPQLKMDTELRNVFESANCVLDTVGNALWQPLLFSEEPKIVKSTCDYYPSKACQIVDGKLYICCICANAREEKVSRAFWKKREEHAFDIANGNAAGLADWLIKGAMPEVCDYCWIPEAPRFHQA